MSAVSGMVLCLAYLVGLLFTRMPAGGYLVLGLGVGLSVGVPRYWRAGPKAKIWLLAGLLGLLASLYFQVRVPQPQANDISKQITDPNAPSPALLVQGRITSLPHLTRSQKAQFWLEVQQVAPSDGKPVTGNLYVTVPLLQATGLHPGQRVSVSGSLYLPKPAANPGGFDFKEYLKQEGSFAGLAGRQVEVLTTSTGWDWWQVQQQIVRSQILWLGSPAGPLVSSMVLGSRGVDLPYEVKDQFVRAGLAHALAASGFQTSLILGVVMALTRRLPDRVQFAIGTSALGIFVGLTGFQPAVLRAAVMGLGGLVALLLKRKVKPLGALLVTAVLLLLWNPLWIWNLGFQLSFLATLGLLVTVPPLTERLDWLPSAIAPLVAVPIAAYLWTLPLQLCAFGVLSPYSIPVNILTTPLISILSLGGMISAVAALIWSPAGSAIAWLLQYPAQGLLALVEVSTQLPGNAYAVGTISVLSAIVLYALIGLTWLQPWWQRRGWLACLLSLAIVTVPAWQARADQFKATVLATTGQPVMVIQEGGQVALVNSGDDTVASLTLLPFLQKEGVNAVRWAVSTDSTVANLTNWNRIADRLPIKRLYTIAQADPSLPQPASPSLAPTNTLPLAVEQTAQLGSTSFKLISANPAIVEFQIHDQTWLYLGAVSPDQQAKLLQSSPLPQAQVLWWNGKRLHPQVIDQVHPQVAIAVANDVNAKTAAQLQQLGTRLYWTGRDGAIQWTPTERFKTMLDSGENNAPAL